MNDWDLTINTASGELYLGWFNQPFSGKTGELFFLDTRNLPYHGSGISQKRLLIWGVTSE